MGEYKHCLVYSSSIYAEYHMYMYIIQKLAMMAKNSTSLRFGVCSYTS